MTTEQCFCTCGACDSGAAHNPGCPEGGNEWDRPSALGLSYVQVRGMDDQALIRAGLDSGDRLAAELANRLDLSYASADPCDRDG